MVLYAIFSLLFTFFCSCFFTYVFSNWQLRRGCKASGAKVYFEAENTRDALFRASVDFVMNTCSKYIYLMPIIISFFGLLGVTVFNFHGLNKLDFTFNHSISSLIFFFLFFVDKYNSSVCSLNYN